MVRGADLESRYSCKRLRGFESRLFRVAKYTREDFLLLRGENLTYTEISQRLGCSISTVCYYLADGQAEKQANRQRKLLFSKPLYTQYRNFISEARSKSVLPKEEPVGSHSKRMRHKLKDYQRTREGAYTSKDISYEEVLDKVGESPVCYLSGRSIDARNTRELHFDHIVPRSKGGDNSLENLGVACRSANIAKNNLSVEELLVLCQDILVHNGYTVVKSGK